MPTKKELRRLRIRRGIRKNLSGTSETPRLSVYRSNKGIYVQLIDDVNGVTLASTSSSLLKDAAGSKVEVSSLVGKEIARIAKDKGIESCVFDRGGYLYHGRVKSLAESAREGGLKF